MRKVAVVLLLLLVLSASALAVPVAKPSLRIVDVGPFIVAGRSFKPNEKVQLVAVSGSIVVKVFRADSLGRFVARLDLRFVLCRGVVVQAFGGRGSRSQISIDATECGASLDPK